MQSTDLSVVGSDDSDVGAGDPDLGGEELLDVVDDDLALLGVEEGRAARLARVRALQRVEYHGESRLQMMSKFDQCNVRYLITPEIVNKVTTYWVKSLIG